MVGYNYCPPFCYFSFELLKKSELQHGVRRLYKHATIITRIQSFMSRNICFCIECIVLSSFRSLIQPLYNYVGLDHGQECNKEVSSTMGFYFPSVSRKGLSKCISVSLFQFVFLHTETLKCR